MIRQLIAIVVLLAGIDCRAQCPGGVCPPNWQPATTPVPANLPRDAVCRIVNGPSLGSGTLIARDDAHGYILTCAHLFREGVAQLMVHFPNGRGYPAQLIAQDAAHDVAILQINRPETAPATFDEAAPNGTLTACGYGGNGQFHAVQGPIVGAATTSGAQHPSTCLRGNVVPGDSGGPVFNTAGKLVGVIWGVRDGITYAMCGTPVRNILQRLTQRRENNNANNARMAPVFPPPPPSGEGLGEGETQPKDRNPAPPTPRIDFAALTTTKLLVTALGLSSPVSVAIIAASFLIRRRRSRRAAHQPIAIDSPPLPQQIIPETHYVPYERDAFAKAHQWAAEQVARKFPGAVEILTALDSLIKQQMNARGP